jgi:septin family protein
VKEADVFVAPQVVGGKGTGKTSLLRLLLETADTSPGATVDQKAAVDRFLKGSTKATQAIQTACVEICESRFDRVLFSIIDTPGLDFAESRELKLERQVNTIIKYVDAQYADTMSEVRTSVCQVILRAADQASRSRKSFDRAKETNISTCEPSSYPDPLIPC